MNKQSRLFSKVGTVSTVHLSLLRIDLTKLNFFCPLDLFGFYICEARLVQRLHHCQAFKVVKKTDADFKT